MSSTVRSYGHIAVLVNPIPEDQLESTRESLDDGERPLQINYDGTLLYSDHNRHKSSSYRENLYGLFIGNKHSQTPMEFADTASAAGFLVQFNTIQPYNCVWYDGSDNPVDVLTKEKFLSPKAGA